MYGDIVPTNLQDELLNIRDSHTRQCWRVGDIVEEVIAFNKANAKACDQLPEMQTIYAAVGLFVGRASRTVREFHHLSKFYAPEIREQFSVLAYDHFRHAAQLGEQSIQALQWAVEQVDELNRPATVDAMLAKFALPEPGMVEPPVEQEEGPGGIYSQIFRSSSTQAMAAEKWLGFDLAPGLREAVFAYLQAALAVVKAIPEGQ